MPPTGSCSICVVGWWWALYALVRLILYVIYLLGLEDTPEFPDIDHAWSEALTQLGRQGLSLQSFPLFMVIGLPEEQERGFLMGAKFPAAATGPSPDTTQPLRIFANAKAAFLFVPGRIRDRAAIDGRSARLTRRRVVHRHDVVTRRDRFGRIDHDTGTGPNAVRLGWRRFGAVDSRRDVHNGFGADGFVVGTCQ